MQPPLILSKRFAAHVQQAQAQIDPLLVFSGLAPNFHHTHLIPNAPSDDTIHNSTVKQGAWRLPPGSSCRPADFGPCGFDPLNVAAGKATTTMGLAAAATDVNDIGAADIEAGRSESTGAQAEAGIGTKTNSVRYE